MKIALFRPLFPFAFACARNLGEFSFDCYILLHQVGSVGRRKRKQKIPLAWAEASKQQPSFCCVILNISNLIAWWGADQS